MTERSSEEISLFDVADWLWSFRWLMLACLAIALAGAALSWQGDKPTAAGYEIKLQIFSGGTPARTPGEIADILIAGLKNDDLVLVSAQAANPVIFRASDAETANRAVATAAALTDAVLGEIRQQEVELGHLLASSDAALPHYLTAKSFNEGVRSGLTPLVATSSAPSPTSQPGRLVGIIVPFLISGFAFVIIAGATSFARAWRERRGAG